MLYFDYTQCAYTALNPLKLYVKFLTHILHFKDNGNYTYQMIRVWNAHFAAHKISVFVLCIAHLVQNYLHRNSYLFAVVAFKYHISYDKWKVHLIHT
jgi:hypothetical protein